MVTRLASTSSHLDSSRGRGHCDIVFLGKTLYSHSNSLHQGTHKWVLANFTLGVALRWTSIPSGGEEKYS